jgi:hypothetical protein
MEHRLRLLFPLVVILSAIVAAIPFTFQVGLLFVTPAMLTVLLSWTGLLGIVLFAQGQQLATDADQSPANHDESSIASS